MIPKFQQLFSFFKKIKGAGAFSEFSRSPDGAVRPYLLTQTKTRRLHVISPHSFQFKAYKKNHLIFCSLSTSPASGANSSSFRTWSTWWGTTRCGHTCQVKCSEICDLKKTILPIVVSRPKHILIPIRAPEASADPNRVLKTDLFWGFDLSVSPL